MEVPLTPLLNYLEEIRNYCVCLGPNYTCLTGKRVVQKDSILTKTVNYIL